MLKLTLTVENRNGDKATFEVARDIDIVVLKRECWNHLWNLPVKTYWVNTGETKFNVHTKTDELHTYTITKTKRK